MLGSPFSLSTSERILPALALNFTTASLDPRVTITRALNTGTRVNSNGLIETINANLPRFDYDPISKICKGLLIEETRIQTARGSDLMSGWSRSSTTAVANVVASPSGVQDADLIYPASSGNNRQVYTQSSTAPTSGSVAISVFAATAGLNWLVIYSLDSITPVAWFNVATGVKGTVVAGWTSEIEPYANGFYRCSVVGTAVSGGYITFGVANADNSIAVTANGTNGLYFWGAQCEAGAFKTSYIRNPDITNGSSVTRNADVVSMTGANFSSWWRAGTGLFAASALVYPLTSTQPLLQADDTTADNLVSLRLASANAELYIKATTDQAQINAGTPTSNTAFRVAGGWATDNCAAALNAGTLATDTTATIPTVTQLRLGSNGTNYLNGNISQVYYWATRGTNAEIQTFSKL